MSPPPLPPVALVNMPFAPARGPSIQLGILRALAVGAGFPVREHHFNLAFLDVLRRHGMDAAYDATLPALVGEWLFSESADAHAATREPGADPCDPARTLQAFARSAGTTPPVLVDVKTRLVPAFLDACASDRGFAGVAAACFTLTFPQVCASLALARRLKEADPGVVIVMGGAASQVHRDSAHELMRLHRFVDVMVHGEAEPVFAELLGRIARRESPRGLPGVVCRTRRGISRPAAPAVVDDVDACPVPDYAGFLAARDALPTPTRSLVGTEVPVEFGRGCVWGQHKPCTFCGFYPLGGFREKTPPRVVEEVAVLRRQTGSSTFTVMDAAVTSALVRRVFPSLRDAHPGLDIRFLQLRTQVTRSQLALLAEAGVRLVQPGIECLESRLLARIAKGTDVFDNLLFLKWCVELGIDVSYNLLLPIPGSTEEELREQLRIVELVPHLPAPYPMRLLLVRGSAYVDDPRAHGLRGVRPDPFYRELFPAGLRPGRVAYQHVCDESDRSLEPVHDATVRQVGLWQRVAGRARLAWRHDGTSGVLVDHRNPARRAERLVLDGPLARAFDALMDRAQRADELAPVPAAELDELVRRGMVLSSGGRFLALATRA